MSEYCLAFDVSNRWLCAGVARVSRGAQGLVSEMLCSRSAQDMRAASRLLVPWLAELLAEAGIARPDWLLSTVGPGSFTGVRIGVTTARNLSQLWDVPVVGIDSLAFYCHALAGADADADADATRAVMLDGKQGRVYARLEGAAGSPYPGSVDLPPLEFLLALPGDLPVWCDDPDAIAKYLPGPQRVELATRLRKMSAPRSGALMDLACRAGGRAAAVSWGALLPVYLRPDPATAKHPGGFDTASKSG